MIYGCIYVLMLIARANSTRDMHPHLTLLFEKVQVVELMMRLFKENRFISFQQHAKPIEVTRSYAVDVVG